MKRIYITVLAAIIASVSCQKNIENDIVDNGRTPFELCVELQELTSTRTFVNDDFGVSWENGDVLYVVTDDGQWGEDDSSDEDGTSIQEFRRDVEKDSFICDPTKSLSDGQHTFHVLYASASQKNTHRGVSTTHTLSSEQLQDCQAPLAHIKENDALVGRFTAEVPLKGTPSVKMSHIYTLMQVNVRNTGIAGTVEKFTMRMESARLAGTSGIDFSSLRAESPEEDSSSDFISVEITNGSIAAENGSLSIYFVMEPVMGYNGQVTFTVTADGKEYSKTQEVTDLTFAAGTYNTTSYTVSLSEEKEKGIYTAEDFISFANAVNADKETYKALDAWAGTDGIVRIYNDINLEGKSQIIWRYDGVLDGLGHTISDYRLSATSTNVGLVADLRGQLRNLNLGNDCSFTQGSTSSEFSIGSFAGRIAAGGSLVGCKSAASVIVNSQNGGSTRIKAGGCAGHVDSGATVSECSFNGSLSVSAPAGGDLIAGGIVGLVNAGKSATTISKCINSSDISLTELQSGKMVRLGGIAGIFRSAASSVSECRNNGNLEMTAKAGNSVLGGIVGFMDIWESYKDVTYTMVSDCVNNGELTLHSDAADGNERPEGGIVGKQSMYSEINGCDNKGTVTNDSKQVAYCGGVVGNAKGAVSGCRNFAQVSITDKYTAGMAHIGGIAGYTDGDGTTNASVKNSGNYGTICFSGTSTGSIGAGGVAGRLCRADIVGCLNAGTIKSTKTGAGSIVGWFYNPASGTTAESAVTGCFAGGSIITDNSETVLTAENFNKYIYGGKPSSGVQVTLSGNAFLDNAGQQDK